MKILDIALKDMLRSFRSLFAVGMMLAAPLLITGLLYFAFGGMTSSESAPSMAPLKVAVVNLDQPVEGMPEMGAQLVTFLKDERMPEWLVVNEIDTESEARAAVDSQQAGVALIIPADFTERLTRSGEEASLIVIQDPTLTLGPRVFRTLLNQYLDGITGARIALDTANSAASSAGTELRPEQIGTLVQTYSTWYASAQQDLFHNQEAGITPLLVESPGGEQQEKTGGAMADVLALVMVGQMIFFAFYTGASTAQSLVKEQEEGTLARLFSTPTSRSEVLAGKFLAVFLTVIVQACVIIAASALIFGIRWAAPLPMFLAVLGLVVVSAGFGILLISFVKTTRQAGSVIGGGLTLTGMMGGLFTVGVAMPKSFQTLSLFFPQGWAMRMWKLTLSGAALSELVLPLVVLLAMGAIFFFGGVLVFRKRFA